MSQTINLELVRQGDAHLKRAKELNPNVTARPVPVAEVGAFDVPTLARLAGVHQQTIRRAITAGELKAARNGRYSQARISRTDAEIWWRERGGGTLLGDLAPNPTRASAPVNRMESVRAARGAMKSADHENVVEKFLEEKHADNARDAAKELSEVKS